ncbi:muramoyltetrapeptide carboxypeptidase [Clostridium saccharoperbutylacetonicum]|uniref:Peptidase U61, LD-carboxypeptidase A n=1 Tax=Clostridium saccharoperbutylacetonicum N1-4(HMT) TaxID=931276 RepID=M1MQP1_9CLOT|nr:LD-carboxypeptidase [Clostridium saccharoperbutylacetonicum]AGF57071.1 peptidase U61, LD-carboxypeptidase A [Clostridium saccharoperbutylacetonicum N1-4(HMT)]NRT62170.1 muramoyltetrapeptide carboxypeptidase [Clostridium saccharoperbutylacetonicum]NSB25501.1 muramoyltetrapeptide carboxypeptidase [Clostridium saccharoperbutylacetonicum]NSB44871.1 muramoyltetrapeptide carboxypeptidase [Clostridium saccharoperbutylacetonicum]
MIRPKHLKKGDKIGLIGSSSPTPQDRIEPSIRAMEALGLEVILGESCLKNHGYLSGTDEIRANDINKMFEDKSIKGIFAIRGGYGAPRILDKLDYDMIKKNPKVFAGYSDITALHNVFNQKCELITFHTPMPSTEIYKGIDEYTLDYFKKNIFSDIPLGVIKNPDGQDLKTLVTGEAEGILVGGNLSLVASSLGTPYEIDTRGKILFLEEIEEYPYKIDRMLVQLKLAGKFKEAAGIILGAWTNCEAKEGDNSLTLMEVFEEIIIPENKTTIYNLACGHCMPTISLPLGTKIKINGYKSEIIM